MVKSIKLVVRRWYVIFWAETNIGKKRSKNEDYMIAYNFDENQAVYCVLDGVGGSDNGDVASKLAGTMLVEYLKQNLNKFDTIKSIKEKLNFSIKYANKCVYNANKQESENRSNAKDMGTTIAVLLEVNGLGYIANVGDTRIYEIKDNSIIQISEDDTYVNALVKDGIISKEDAAIHPEKHVLLKALGITRSISFEIKELGNIQNHSFLLCSDGLSNCVSDEEILSIINKYSCQDICSKLIERANENGGMDNITAIYIKK